MYYPVSSSPVFSIKTKEGMLMFRKLINTTDDLAITVLRLVLGVVFFAHGAQKALGWFGATDSPAPWPSSPNRRISMATAATMLQAMPKRRRDQKAENQADAAEEFRADGQKCERQDMRRW